MKPEFAPGILSLDNTWLGTDDPGTDEWYGIASVLLERGDWALLEQLTDYGYSDWPDWATEAISHPDSVLTESEMYRLFSDYLDDYEQDEPDLLWGAWELIDDPTAPFGLLWVNPTDPRYPANTFSASFAAGSSWPYARVYWSEYVTLCNLCSPCYPGQGNLDDLPEQGLYGVWAYTLPPCEFRTFEDDPDWSMYAISLPVSEAMRRVRWTTGLKSWRSNWSLWEFGKELRQPRLAIYLLSIRVYSAIAPKLARARAGLKRQSRNFYYRIRWLARKHAASMLQRFARLVRR